MDSTIRIVEQSGRMRDHTFNEADVFLVSLKSAKDEVNS